MRFQVPQFVDIEDRIIGPLTIKQFAFYMIAAMIIGILYVAVSLGLLIVLALPIVGVAVLFAHARFFGQPFARVLFNGVNYAMGSKLYLWRRTDRDDTIKISGGEFGDGAEGYEASSIDLMSQTLNTEGNIVEADLEDPLLEEKPGSDGAAVGTGTSDKAFIESSSIE